MRENRGIRQAPYLPPPHITHCNLPPTLPLHLLFSPPAPPPSFTRLHPTHPPVSLSLPQPHVLATF
ncbi:hypothetical protein E2C01_042629 [Portunus trituberculatus]|uniref:Uncharacterized protein n=1 Tax=Portunus trituberculatus TaxID=210409 RepID=A0A5B7FX11_PORTR|nr:hypothetical protein [Portunus trituberculatus]